MRRAAAWYLLDDDLFAPVSSQTWGIARYSGAIAVMPYGIRASLGLEPGAVADLSADARTMGVR